MSARATAEREPGSTQELTSELAPPKPRKEKTSGNTPTRQIFLIRVDGNIGSGKSTLIARLRERFPTSHIIPEPTEHWFRVRDDAGRNPLSAFYADPKKYAALFQLFAFVTRLEEVEGTEVRGRSRTKELCAGRSSWIESCSS